MAARSKELIKTPYRERWGWVAARGIFALLFGVIALIWPGISLFALVILFGAYALIDGIASLAFAASGGKTPSGRTWPLVLMGLAGIGAAVAAFVWPGVTAFVLLWIIAAWAVATGILEVIAYFSLRKNLDHSWLLLASGLLSIAFGAALMLWPVAGLLTVVVLVGVYAILAGLTLLALAFAMRRSLKHKTPVDRRQTPPGEPTPA
ncbi:HdeD family acid-resistance protein [Persicimonas caeni]|uniref:HdeD family acid-resistance protein n=1 Tax=Persicimonas caeni TaxID=2292766 RepID=A0A4Y6Q025_PERCE|nr:HdeD family acid-resistance protein [Persicimonas caeni]QDG53840.1 HdeD family acid-resistance protein [Persicimonas caeni]QED35061.1 HdeD family acid-resistance protein [Persicimonas caeni]